MSFVTKNVSRYIKKKGITLSKISKETGVPYSALHTSLNDGERNRDLRDDEFIKICCFLDVNPMEFANRPDNSTT